VKLTGKQLTGLDSSHLVAIDEGHRLQPAVVQSLARLKDEARDAGFELAIASSFRSFARQLRIFNGKASGERATQDDNGVTLDFTDMSAVDRLHAILRYSALPGTSRHHWGTDLDVFDAAAVDADYRVQLTPAEVGQGGVFEALHNWLDERMGAGASHGFFRPYGVDRGGVAAERWHLSYAPLALGCASHLNAAMLRDCWDRQWNGEELALRDEIEADLPQLLERYVSVPADWCPAGSH
jgi:LAS superfamily LD-carboxypeptidase LdcB